MTDDGTAHADVVKHPGGNFAGKGARGILVDIFGADFKMGAERTQRKLSQINEGGADDGSAGGSGRRKKFVRPTGIGLP